MNLDKKVFQLVRFAIGNLQAEVAIDDNSITIDLDPDRPFIEMDEDMMDDTFRLLKLDRSYVFRSAGYHYYIREEAFR